MAAEAATPAEAVYYQRSKSVQEEFKLIEFCTERELVVEELETIIRDVKEHRKELEDDTILETFRLFNRLRDISMKLLKAIAGWQISFTKPIRPTLLNCDYMVERIVKQMDFINASKIRKIFNFQFFRGNALLLPYPSLKTETPIKVGKELGAELQKFSAPNEDDVIASYQVLIDSLPDDVYRDQLVALDKWLVNPWVPRIWISSSNKKFFVVEKPTNPKALPPAPPDDPKQTTQAVKTQTSPNRGHRQSVFAKKAEQSGSDKVKAPQLKRRNQMLVKEAEGLLGYSGAEPAAPAEVDAPLSHEDQEQIDQMDFYYKELESMFVPKLGRRSVKTIVVGGSRLMPTQQEGARRTMLFSHTPKADATDVLQAALNGVNTNAFLRTNAQMIAKRDRILADRKPEAEYQKHTSKSTGVDGGTPLAAVVEEDEGAVDQTSLAGSEAAGTALLRRASDAGASLAGEGSITSVPAAVATSPSTSPTPSRGGVNGNSRKSRSRQAAASQPLHLNTMALRDWYQAYSAATAPP